MNYISELEFEKLINSDKPVLVQYSAPWCVYCRRIAPVMERIVQQYSDIISVVTIDIDKQEALANKEQIEVIPTLVIYQEGMALGSIVAPESKARIDSFIMDTLRF